MQSESSQLEKRIDLLIRLSAVQLVTGKSQKEQIRLLSVAGMGPSEIAEMLGTTANTVNVALSSLRKRGRLNLKNEQDKEDS